ncbi:MAG: APC family permease [Polyangiaceae bacterium]|nr:APC family permease [Polyangiaceae bacterium]
MRERGILGPVALFALGLNGIVGVGIFFVPRDVAGLAPGMVGVLTYLITALALLPVAATYAILGSRFPEDGGPHVWARAAFGSTVAFVVGWVAFTSAVFSTAAVVLGLAETAAPVLPGAVGASARVVSVIVLGGFGLVAAVGLRPSAVVWTAVTCAKLLPLVLLVGVGVGFGGGAGPALPAPGNVDVATFVRALLVVVFALQGFEIVAVPAGQARGGRIAVPFATVGSLGVAALLYAAVHWVTVRAVPGVAGVERPLVHAGEVLGGGPIGALVGLGAAVSAAGIAFGMIVMTPRYLAALGRADGFGVWIGREESTCVPLRALLVTLLLVGVLVLLALGAGVGVGLRELFVLSSVMVLLQYGVSSAALLVLGLRSRSGIRLRDVWPVPLAGVVIIGIGAAATPGELETAAAVVALGLLVPLGRRVFAASS